MAGLRKHYSNGEIVVVWEPGKCFHSGVCFAGLPAVFDPRKRPWVNIVGAPTAAIVAQVGRCPSGARSLGAREDEAAPPRAEVGPAPPASPAAPTVEVRPNGPNRLAGPVTVRRPDGTLDCHENGCLLCRCGQSGNKPYCDGSHARTGFEG